MDTCDTVGSRTERINRNDSVPSHLAHNSENRLCIIECVPRYAITQITVCIIITIISITCVSVLFIIQQQRRSHSSELETDQKYSIVTYTTAFAKIKSKQDDISPVNNKVKDVTCDTSQVTGRLKDNCYDTTQVSVSNKFDKSLSSKGKDNKYATSRMSVKKKYKSYSSSTMSTSKVNDNSNIISQLFNKNRQDQPETYAIEEINLKSKWQCRRCRPTAKKLMCYKLTKLTRGDRLAENDHLCEQGNQFIARSIQDAEDYCFGKMLAVKWKIIKVWLFKIYVERTNTGEIEKIFYKHNNIKKQLNRHMRKKLLNATNLVSFKDKSSDDYCIMFEVNYNSPLLFSLSPENCSVIAPVLCKRKTFLHSN